MTAQVLYIIRKTGTFDDGRGWASPQVALLTEEANGQVGLRIAKIGTMPSKYTAEVVSELQAELEAGVTMTCEYVVIKGTPFIISELQ